jgi:hypothetical protein
MNRYAAVAFIVMAACAPSRSVTDRRAVALEGDWRLELHDASGQAGKPETGRIALVAVRHEAGQLLPGEESLLAAGAVSMDDGTLERLVSDGTRVTAHAAGGDSVSLRFASARGEYYVVLAGTLHSDTLAGEWRSVLARTGGSSGRFAMIRRR